MFYLRGEAIPVQKDEDTAPQWVVDEIYNPTDPTSDYEYATCADRFFEIFGFKPVSDVAVGILGANSKKEPVYALEENDPMVDDYE